MTRRLLVLGNSHLAALREAWARHAHRWPGLAPTFLGAHGDLLSQTRVQDNRLTPATQAAKLAFRQLNGIEEVDLAAQDGIVICGAMVAAALAVGLWREARWPGLPSLRRATDLATLPGTMISRRAALAALTDLLESRQGPRLVRHLRAGTGLPIWLASQPRVSAVVLDRPRPEVRAQLAAVRAGDGAELSDLFDAAAAQAAARAGARWLPQPAQTREADLLTGAAFMRDAMRLAARPGTPQPEADISHANADYGAAVLDQIAAITAAGPPR